ncbi:MAG: hypothetical protein NZM37_08400 [Sandaracinaceae bacterium]|nr:hypothetical protein [Sandaracinaceae bacterium]MDW8245013.1 hypothetical protein [Sandaracinaceae bacterium]
MGWSERLKELTTRLLQDERVGRLLRDERALRLIGQLLELQGRLRTGFDRQVEALARFLGLATQDEVKELKRLVRRLEQELRKSKREETPPPIRHEEQN